MEENGRRNFLTRAIFGLSALITAGLGLPAAAYLLGPSGRKREGEWIEVGDAGSLAAGRPEEVVFRRNRLDGWKVSSEKSTAWLVKSNAGGVVAFSPICTHLGCAYDFDESKGVFVCPCHTSSFSVDGKVLSGPAPRPLDRYLVKVENGKVLLSGLDSPQRSA